MKHKIKSNIPQKSLHTIQFDHYDEILWIREGKEFMLGDRLYDIVKSDPNNPLTLYCIDDIQETKLFSHLTKEVNKQTQDPNQPLNKLAKVLLDQAYHFEDFNTSYFGKPELITEQKSVIAYVNNYSSVHLQPDNPPPVV